MRDYINKIIKMSDKLMSGSAKKSDLLKVAAELRKISNEFDSDQNALTMSSFIDELNIDLSLEYSALIQYLQHAAMVKGLGFESFIPQLLEHADDEFKHAKLLTEKINYLGGTPILFAAEALSSDNSKEMLIEDLHGEKNAIQRYKIRIQQAEKLGEYGIKNMLEGILLDEENHENDIMTILGINKR